MTNSGATLTSRIEDYIFGMQGEFLDYLRRLTLAESPSDDPVSQTESRNLITGALSDLGFRVRWLPGRRTGGSLFARPASRRRGAPNQLLLGHYDTVWPLGILKSMPFSVEGDIVRGPGVYDMKAGVTQMIFALRALRAAEFESAMVPVVFLNSDEEIGSFESRAHIEKIARRVDRVFVMEPSLGPGGKLKTQRKAVGRYTVVVKGKAAHAGLNPESGASAILEMSHVIQALFDLNDSKKGVTVNVGTVDGGLRPNVVAPESSAHVDVRAPTQAEAERVQAEILGLKPITAGVSLEVCGRINRPALEHTPRTQRLWDSARVLGARLGLQLEQGAAGGGSDGSFTSQTAATLDGLGAVGEGAHAPNEHIRLESTIRRAALLALLMAEPPQGPL